ncbi:MAG TPA: hypothetical protein VMV49_09410 [Candidatus Deferrimicrobium sp.]|nr:hypothetical protein [Candidatus Deferrimicrobium sp.]
MIRGKIDNYVKKNYDGKLGYKGIDPYIIQNCQVLETIYGKKLYQQINTWFLQQEIETLLPFFQNKLQYVHQLILQRVNFDQTTRFYLEPGINILKDSEDQFFRYFAMGLLSHPQNIGSKADTHVELDFSINKTPFNLKRDGNNLDLVELNKKVYRNLSKAQIPIALNLGIFHLSKRKTSFGLNVFDNIIFINLNRKPRDFKEKERMFLFGTPEIREKLYIYHILQITIGFYKDQMNKNQKQIKILKSDIEKLQIINNQKTEEKLIIEDDLEKIGLKEESNDKITELLLEKVKEKSFYEQQLELYEKKQGIDTQQTKFNIDPLLIKERKLSNNVEELKNNIEKLKRKKTILFLNRQNLRDEATGLYSKIFNNRVCMSCGFNVDEVTANERTKEQKCPVCGNIPPDQTQRSTELKRIKQDITELRIKDKKLEEEIGLTKRRHDIQEDQLKSIRELIEKAKREIINDKSEEICCSIKEAFKKFIELTNFINSIENIRSRKPRIYQLIRIITQNNKQIEKNGRLIKSYDKKLREINSIHEGINSRSKSILDECRSLFRTPAIKLGNTLGKNMAQLISEFNPEQLDLNSEVLVNLNYYDIIRSIKQPIDSTSTRLFYFISLLEISLNGYFTMPNLYIITGITIEALEKFRDIFIQLDQNYKEQFQIIFLIKSDHHSKKIPAQWYKTSQGSRNPLQRTL